MISLLMHNFYFCQLSLAGFHRGIFPIIYCEVLVHVSTPEFSLVSDLVLLL